MIDDFEAGFIAGYRYGKRRGYIAGYTDGYSDATLGIPAPLNYRSLIQESIERKRSLPDPFERILRLRSGDE